MKKSLYTFSLWTLTLVMSIPLALAASPQKEAAEIHELLTAWQTVEARSKLELMLKKDAREEHYRFAKARLQYFEGSYGDALSTLDALAGDMKGKMPESFQKFRHQVEDTHATLKSFDEYQSPDGRFLIRYTGRDKVLIPYLMEVLEATDGALSKDFDYSPKGRVLVEIYPEISYLAKVSPLSETDIETSGTIALCKYNRLMFTSPRALVRGYGWRDTVAHEFVHYYVTKLSRNTVPIWLHEGIAKFQETRWREAPGHRLDPPEEDMLARNLKLNKLITFDQMHPSMAKLPSQEAASLAFAEVHTVIDFLHRRSSYEGLRHLIGTLRSKANMNAALKRVYGFELTGLWSIWKSDLERKGLKEYPGLVQQSLEFKRPGDAEKDETNEINYGSIKQKKVRDFTHLGELLRARKRPKAALKEYQKAELIGGDGNPTIQNGAAESLLHLKRFKEIPKVLARVRSYYPRFLRTHLNLGSAFIQLKNSKEAIEAFEAVIGINPFHPAAYIALDKLYRQVGKIRHAEQALKSLELLR
jgi:tetratricopeptide (TPR) repeat protein